MIKPLIYLRKKVLLPLRWRKERKQIADGVEYPPALVLVEMREQLLKDVVTAKSRNNYKKSYKLQGKIDLIDWLIAYGSSTQK